MAKMTHNEAAILGISILNEIFPELEVRTLSTGGTTKVFIQVDKEHDLWDLLFSAMTYNKTVPRSQVTFVTFAGSPIHDDRGNYSYEVGLSDLRGEIGKSIKVVVPMRLEYGRFVLERIGMNSVEFLRLKFPRYADEIQRVSHPGQANNEGVRFSCLLSVAEAETFLTKLTQAYGTL